MKSVRWIQKLNPELLDKEVHKFKEITAEATFLIRALFFLLFGFLIDTKDILNPEALLWTLVVVSAIFIFRLIVLKLVGAKLNPLVFIAPRGLITILLFFGVGPVNRIEVINRSLVLQVILLTAFIMMIGMIVNKKEKAVLSERHEIL